MEGFYSTREERSRWLTSRFAGALKGKVLDVGCYNKDVRKYVKSKAGYVGLDLYGSPDVRFDLDSGQKLPFKDKQFDAVIAADVLEHLDKIHFVFDEICRVSKGSVIISLPNPAVGVFSYLRRSRSQPHKEKGKYLKYYGLPLEAPEDRHRWFFGFDEAVDFVEYRARKNGFKVQQVLTDYEFLQKARPLHKRILVWLINLYNPNLARQSIIFLLKRR